MCHGAGGESDPLAEDLFAPPIALYEDTDRSGAVEKHSVDKAAGSGR